MSNSVSLPTKVPSYADMGARPREEYRGSPRRSCRPGRLDHQSIAYPMASRVAHLRGSPDIAAVGPILYASGEVHR
jgi:hypothetical protein